MRLNNGMTRKLSKRLKASSNNENTGKKPFWIEYSEEVGEIKHIGEKSIMANGILVGSINKQVATKRGTF